MKIRDEKKVWVETRVENTYNRHFQAIEELKKSRTTDDQGNPIMLSDEETFSCWLDVVGGMYKERSYDLFFENNFTVFSMDCKVYGVLPPCQIEKLEEMR
ncbi:hypothetical protein P3L10_029688 [Capsicum annuum]